MIGIQVITHGKMAQGIVNSAEMIIGDIENITMNGLTHDQSVEDFQSKVLNSTEKVLGTDGVLVFVDMFGATPYNTALINSRAFSNENYKVITGVSLPLLIEAISTRESMPLKDLYNHILDISTNVVTGWEKEDR